MSRKKFLLLASFLGSFSLVNFGATFRLFASPKIPREALSHYRLFAREWTRTCRENGIPPTWIRKALRPLETKSFRSTRGDYALVFRNASNDFVHLIQRQNKRSVMIAKQLRREWVEMS